MPERVEPALAQLKSRPPKGNEWSWEVKLDGYCLAIHIELQGIRILTRGGHDWTHRFPAIEQAARALGPATMIIDGEAVVLDAEGRPDFGLLQQSLGASDRQAGNEPPTPSFTLSILFIWTATICAVLNTGPADTFSRTH
ncbi:ATP-dependent DNA ligase [Rhizobium leguminosarum]